jgi:hypothetical protein
VKRFLGIIGIKAHINKLSYQRVIHLEILPSKKARKDARVLILFQLGHSLYLRFHFLFFVGNCKPQGIDLFLVVAVVVLDNDVFQIVVEQFWHIIVASIAIFSPSIAEGVV